MRKTGQCYMILPVPLVYWTPARYECERPTRQRLFCELCPLSTLHVVRPLPHISKIKRLRSLCYNRKILRSSGYWVTEIGHVFVSLDFKTLKKQFKMKIIFFTVVLKTHKIYQIIQIKKIRICLCGF